MCNIECGISLLWTVASVILRGVSVSISMMSLYMHIKMPPLDQDYYLLCQNLAEHIFYLHKFMDNNEVLFSLSQNTENFF